MLSFAVLKAFAGIRASSLGFDHEVVPNGMMVVMGVINSAINSLGSKATELLTTRWCKTTTHRKKTSSVNCLSERLGDVFCHHTRQEFLKENWTRNLKLKSSLGTVLGALGLQAAGSPAAEGR